MFFSKNKKTFKKFFFYSLKKETSNSEVFLKLNDNNEVPITNLNNIKILSSFFLKIILLLIFLVIKQNFVT